MSLTTLPTKDDSSTAQNLLEHFPTSIEEQTVQITVNHQSFDLPPAVQKLLLQAIENIAEGKAISLIPINSELTTQQAADFLNVSRPFLIGLLNQGQIKYKKVGTHRRVLFEDLVKYKEESYKKSMKALDEIVRISEELNLYD
ncbi:MAG: helix-turn-helix domain-containing protein [Candidatus Caenarcaniphilales bacterium]|nr:helix-turn-helix domain-containing protein [Candidatus Caenarcaniphilales bacterium]